MGDYPKRPKFFALRFCRLMAKDCLANIIGAEACWLLTVIAHTEDAKGYRGAVSYFNEQLMPIVGAKNVKALARIREKAVKSGWLTYIPGGKSTPGQYWVTIPERNLDWDDAPTDEQTPAGIANSPDYSGTKSPQEPGEKREVSGERTGREPGEKREVSGQPSSLFLFQDNLSLSQNTPLPPVAGGVSECGSNLADSVHETPPPEPTPARGPDPAAVVAHWNSFPGLTPAVGREPHRDRVIRSLAIDPQTLWAQHWQAAIAFMGRTPFFCGGGPSAWRANLGWILKADNFASVVERMLAESAPPAPSARSPTPAKETARQRVDRLCAEAAAKAKARQNSTTNTQDPPCTTNPSGPTGTANGSGSTSPASASAMI